MAESQAVMLPRMVSRTMAAGGLNAGRALWQDKR
jgi:hypothetical protein